MLVTDDVGRVEFAVQMVVSRSALGVGFGPHGVPTPLSIAQAGTGRGLCDSRVRVNASATKSALCS